MTETLEAKVIRGTCASCGRWITTYAKKEQNQRYACTHKAWKTGIENGVAENLWQECKGSNQPVKV